MIINGVRYDTDARRDRLQIDREGETILIGAICGATGHTSMAGFSAKAARKIAAELLRLADDLEGKL